FSFARISSTEPPHEFTECYIAGRAAWPGTRGVPATTEHRDCDNHIETLESLVKQYAMPGTAVQSPADARRVAVASAIGTTIEWYDFFICVHCRYSWAIRRLGANTVSCERGACGGRLVCAPKPG